MVINNQRFLSMRGRSPFVVPDPEGNIACLSARSWSFPGPIEFEVNKGTSKSTCSYASTHESREDAILSCDCARINDSVAFVSAPS